MTWIIYNPTTLDIQRIDYSSDAPDAPGQSVAQVSDAVTWLSQNSAAFRFIDGAAVLVDLRTLADVKATKNSAINQARAAANSSTFPFQGKQIAVDQLSRSDIDATHGAILMLQALPPGWPGAWKATDNTFIAIPNVATWAQFYGAMVATGTANFNHSQVLKAQMDAATTIAEVEAVPNW
jgi:hypothetical protein